MMHPRETRLRATALRREGASLRVIAGELGIALSTASLWVRDVVPVTVPPAVPDAAAVPDAVLPEVTQVRRICRRCARELPLSDFARHRDAHQWWCRACFRGYQAGRAAQNRRQDRDRIRCAQEHVLGYLAGRACQDCAAADPVVLEFDHVRGEKRLEVSLLVNRAASRATLDREFAKCDVVCVNSHRRRTLARSGGPRRARLPHELRGRTQLDAKLATGCLDCGEPDPVVLDVDHRGPKRGRVAQMVREGYSASVIAAELAGCEVRCGNCHRRRTAAERGFYRAVDAGDDRPAWLD
jgi:hypothetical protein